MARKLASVQTINSVEPVPNSDNLDVVGVLGWKCVTHRGDFKVGDPCVYFEIDSFLPIKPEFEFLRQKCYRNHPEIGEGFRLKTIKLRGQISQGLVMKPEDVKLTKNVKVDDDLTEMLEVRLYFPPVPAELKGIQKGSFPSFCPKTDETRVQVLQNVLTRYKGMKCYVTEKVDGSSVTYYLKDGEFGVCSRNVELVESEENAYWELARKLDIEKKLRDFLQLEKDTIALNPMTDIAIQGELIGPGIQGNRLKLSEKRIFFFNIFDIKAYKYFEYKDFVSTIKMMGLETVPIIDTNFTLIDDVDELLRMANGKSLVNPSCMREGIVIRPIEEKIDLQMAQGLGNGRLSFKAISNDYLCDEKG
jgi:RNA ligase (TIGR02306 family)